MAIFTVQGVTLAGVCACVPKNTEDNAMFSVLPENERELFIKTTGIRYRRVAPNGITTSDLCFHAAEKLLKDLGWNRSDVKVLVFASQTPDYLIPNTSSILQDRLKLSKNCLAFDVNIGCSGYVYGLSIIGSLLQQMPGAKALLLVGDISTSTISMKDRITAPLFSDAGTATALEFAEKGYVHFNLQSDGAEFDDIIIPDGGMKNKFNIHSLEPVQYESGVERNNLQMKLDGIKVFNFVLREIAPNIEALFAEKKIDKASIDYFVFHQANLLMLESVRRKLHVEPEKVPYSLYNFGNTSSATIPLTMAVILRSKLTTGKVRLLLSGFGVGLSWGCAYIETEKIVCPELIEI